MDIPMKYEDVVAKLDAALETIALKHRDMVEAQTAVTGWTRKYDALQQRLTVAEQLLQRVIDSSVLSFEQDAPEELESLEADICASLKPEEGEAQ